MNFVKYYLSLFLLALTNTINAQDTPSKLLTIDRIYNSNEFSGEYQRSIFWINDGDAFITIEGNGNNEDQLMRYESKNNKQTVFSPCGGPKATGQAVLPRDGFYFLA